MRRAQSSPSRRRSELSAALWSLRGALGGVAALSAGINLLTLTGSIYMMMVYDRILPSQSGATLLSLFLMVIAAYAFYGLFDVLRAHLLSDVGLSLERMLHDRVQRLDFTLAAAGRRDPAQPPPLRDLDQIRAFLGSAGPAALIDLPWILFFVLLLTAVHWSLGLVTLAAGIVLCALTLAADRSTRAYLTDSARAGLKRETLAQRSRSHAELIRALGMRDAMLGQHAQAGTEVAAAQAALAESTARFAGWSRVFRMFVQAAVLSVGAVLVIDNQASGGVIFAASILSGRALAPVDAAIANWRGFVGAREAWARLGALLDRHPAEADPEIRLPPPVATLTIERVTLVPPGSERIAVAEVSFQLRAGQVLAILGPSAAGKSSLVRGIIGAWPAARGTVRLDGAALNQWPSETLGRHIGYLPQSVELFGGTIAQNIARFDPDADDAAVMAAARAAGVHDAILAMPGGYSVDIGEGGQFLSAGQRQRIGLARALYGDPFLVVLDEPNSNLDGDGEAALSRALADVGRRGGIAIVVAHRKQVLDVATHVAMLQGGQLRAFGPKEQVLARLRQAAATAKGDGDLTVIDGGRRP
ncbi:type I secretion system permease/ATPase [Sphingomonas sp. CJ99]